MESLMILKGVATSLGSILAEKGLDYFYKRNEEKSVISNAINKTAEKYKGFAPGGKKAVKDYLDQWTSSDAFEEFLINLHKGETIENTLEKAEKSFKAKTVSHLRKNANVVLAFLLKSICDGLIDSSQGRSIMMNHINAQFEDLSDKTDEHAEALRKNLKSLRAPDKEAVAKYLKFSDERPSLKELTETGLYSKSEQEIENRLNKLDEIIGEFSSSEQAFKNYRVELYLKLASVQTQLGDFDEAGKNYHKAEVLGINSSKQRRTALKVLLNLDKIEEYERVLHEGDVENREVAEIELHALKSDWKEVLEKIPLDTENYRLIYLSIIARLEVYNNEELELYATDILEDLKKANGVKKSQPLFKVQLANIGVTLLEKLCLGMVDAQDFNRGELVGYSRSLLNKSLNECRALEYSKGVVVSLQTALRFYSMLEEERALKSSEKELKKENFIIDEDLSRAQELYQKGIEFLRNTENSISSKKAKSFLESAFELAKDEEKTPIAQSLINFYLDSHEISKAKNVLTRIKNISQHTFYLLQLSIVQEEKNPNDIVAFLNNCLEDFPLSIQLRRFKIEALVQQTVKNIGDGSLGDNKEILEEIKDEIEILDNLLPTDSNRILYAKALITSKDFNAAINELEKVSIDTEVYVTALELIIHSLLELDRIQEVPSYFIKLADITRNPKYANEAGRYLLQINRFQEACEILEEWVKQFPDNPFLKANLALGLISKEDITIEEGERAFNLLSEANDEYADFSNIDFWLAKAAKKAGKSGVFQQYSRRHWANVPTVSVSTKEDFITVQNSLKDGTVMVDFDGKKGIKAFSEWNDEFKSSLNLFHDTDLMSYVDTFDRNNQPWRQWIDWTTSAKSNYSENVVIHAIKSVWPFIQERNDQHGGILLDLTALLSLCSLSKTEEIIADLNQLGFQTYLRTKEFKKLRAVALNVEENIFEIDKFSYFELENELKKYDLFNKYESDQIQKFHDLVSEHLKDGFGNHTVDYGLSLYLEDAYFIADIKDGFSHEDKRVVSKLTSSKVLLKSLVDSGLVGQNEANEAVNIDDRFKGWQAAKVIELPQNIVFSAFSIRLWYEAGLLFLDDSGWLKNQEGWPKIHIGPFGNNYLLREAHDSKVSKKTKELATDQLTKLNKLINSGAIELLPDQVNNGIEENGHFSQMNPNVIEILKLTQSKKLALWTDDRVFGYLAWPFNHPLPFPDVREELNNLKRGYPDFKILTTEDILEILKAKKTDQQLTDVESLGYELVEMGYRPLNFRLAVSYLLNNYSYNRGAPKFKSFFKVLEDQVANPFNYSREASKIDPKPYQRLFLGKILPDLIAHILLSNSNITFKKRKSFATDLLEVMIDYIETLRSTTEDKMTLFWVSLMHCIVYYQELNNVGNVNDDFPELVNEALKWASESLIKFENEEYIFSAIYEIEDLIINLVKRANEIYGEIEGEGKESHDKHRYIAKRIHPFLVSLFQDNVLKYFNPILRRSLGKIVRHQEEFKISEIYTFGENDKEVNDEVKEDEIEIFAIKILKNILKGNTRYDQFLTADLRVFCNWNRSQPKKVNENETYAVPINISIVQLLLRDELHAMPGIIDSITIQLQLIDPILGQKLEDLSEYLKSEDPEIRLQAQEELSIEIISSVYFELQRSLSHALKKVQEIETSVLDEFLSPSTGWSSHEAHPAVFILEGKEYPRNVLLDIYTLTLKKDMLYTTCTKSVETKISNSSKEIDSGVKPKVTYSDTIENSISSFNMAYRLLEFMIWASKDNSEYNYKGENITPTYFINEILTQTIDKRDAVKEGSKVEGNIMRNGDLKVIHACIFRLATYAIGSPKHISYWQNELNDEEEVISSFNHGILIFSHRLMPFLIGKYEGNYRKLKEDLIETVHSLSIAYDNAKGFPDFFNPLLFGPHLLDHEVASIFNSLIVFIENDETPQEVLDFEFLESLVKPWPDFQNDDVLSIYERQKETAFNSLGIKMSFSPKEGALKLLELLQNQKS